MGRKKTQVEGVRDVGEAIRRRLEELPVVQEILADMAAADAKAKARRVDADPEKHKTTRLMEEGRPHSYWAYAGGTDEHGREVTWCYSCWRNRAGYFLVWREVWNLEKGEGFRDRWSAHKKRKVASAMAERWAMEDREASEKRKAAE